MQDKSVGVVPVYIDSDDTKLFCLIHSANGNWGFPKGHPDGVESEELTARRELQEETGISDVSLVRRHTFSEAYSFEKDGEVCTKQVYYFVGFVKDINNRTPIEFKEEILELCWFTYNEARERITFEESKLLLDEVWIYLQTGT